MDSRQKRIRARARRLWEDAGKPSGGPEGYLDRACELVAIEEHAKDTLVPTGAQARESVEDDPVASDAVRGPGGEPIELALAVETEGKFPTLTDQGKGLQVPRRRRKPR